MIWTQSAFESLNQHFGSFRQSAALKSGYKIQREVLSNSDVARLINSDEIQRVVRPARKNVRAHLTQRKNPLRNVAQYRRLNPFVAERRQKTQEVTKPRARISKEDRQYAMHRRRTSRKRLIEIEVDVTTSANTVIKEYGQIMEYSSYM